MMIGKALDSWANGFSTPDRGRDFSLLPNDQTDSVAHPGSCPMVTGSSLPREVKRPKEPHQSLPSSSEHRFLELKFT